MCVCVCVRKEKGGRLIFGEARPRNEWGGGLSGYHPHLSRRPFCGSPKVPNSSLPLKSARKHFGLSPPPFDAGDGRQNTFLEDEETKRR